MTKPGKSKAAMAQGRGNQAKSALAEQRRLSSTLLLQATALETVANSVMITDHNGVILWTNPAFTELTGYAPAEVLGQNPRILQSGQHDRSFYKELWRVILSGETWRGEFANRRKDASIYYDQQTITPVRGEDGRISHFVSVMQDVSERKQVEARIKKLNEELEERVRVRTSQLEAANRELEAFACSVSHDLRAPLRAIDGFARIVREDYAPRLGKEGQRLLDTICSEAQHMHRLIDSLLAFSKVGRQMLDSSPVDMAALARDEFTRLTAHAESPPRLELKALPPAKGDLAMLRQVFSNLISNAIKFSSRQTEPVIEIGGQPGAEEHLYYVKDNGVGFDERFGHKLFSIFQRLHTEEEFEGTGVGLALVERIVRRHGGRVWAEGKINHGATFYFALPACLEAAPALD